ncbi:MAG: histidine kinase, partial [Burkholderiales bacterium]|nr:histidine kinase [Burkholderiales bacterium]
AAGAAPAWPAWPAWWAVQAAMLALVAGAVAVLARSQRELPHPFSTVLLRLLAVVGATLAVLTAALAAAGAGAALQAPALLAVLAWSLFAASLTVWVPFLVRGRPLLPEIGLVAGLAALAASLHLALLAAGVPDALVAALAAVTLALLAYALARRWLVGPLGGGGALPAERAFEHLVAVARELVDHPERHEALLARLLRELFDPVELHPLARALPAARVVADGAALAVPVRAGEDGDAPPLALLLRFARRGRHLFTLDDARLADRIAEQLRRAAAWDRAVEHGRSEERRRIAQDLHDDIGARLLTLMYRAQDPEVESYLRHTLQDLKTLTRGLAAREHRLSHAAAEWKADLQHRLEAAQVDLEWSFDHGADPVIGIGQWSALTRILRELATNAMAHAHATRLEVSASLRGGTLALRVADDGDGRAPETWAPGLGLGGVRKRVRQLGGRAQWRERAPRGIVCEVELPLAPPP